MLVRVHSECLTGDVFHSLRCDCGEQLELALQRIAAEDNGVLLYMSQEGRGIGLLAKLKAYELQENGLRHGRGEPRSSASRLTRGSTGSARRSSPTSASRPSASSRTTRGRSPGIEGFGLKVVEQLPIEVPPNMENQQLPGHEAGQARPPAPPPGAALRGAWRRVNEELRVAEHAVGRLRLPEGVGVIAGSPNGARRAVGIVVARFNGEITIAPPGRRDRRARGGRGRARADRRRPGARRLRAAARRHGARQDPPATPASSRSAASSAARRRTSTSSPAEAASGLQLAALETGVPVSFGVLTTRDEGPGRGACRRGSREQGRRGGALRARDGRRLRPPARSGAAVALRTVAILVRRCPRSAQSVGRARRSVTTEATRWWRRSGASTRTSSASASS